MAKKILFTVIGLLVVVGVLAGTKMAQFKAMGAQQGGMPPEAVATAVVEVAEWEPSLPAIGSITAVQGVVVSSEVSGKVVKIAFESGARVNEGDLLVELDSSVERALLRSAEAAADLARVNLQRARELREKDTNSQADLDTAEARAKEAEAQVENIRASLAKKIIRAPFSGRLGIREVNLGEFLDTGAAIVSLQSLDPVYVNFSLPQQQLALIETGLTVRLHADVLKGKPVEGELTAINSALDPVTRAVKIQATVANPEHLLRSGMFVNVEVVLPAKEKNLIIPATSVIYAPYGDSVFVVEDAKEGGGKVVRQQFIRLGATRGDFVAVAEGLNEGQTIVSTGAFKLRNGTSVMINNELAPKPELAPTPADS